MATILPRWKTQESWALNCGSQNGSSGLLLSSSTSTSYRLSTGWSTTISSASSTTGTPPIWSTAGQLLSDLSEKTVNLLKVKVKDWKRFCDEGWAPRWWGITMKILPIYKLSYQRVIPSGSGTDEKINSILLKVVALRGAIKKHRKNCECCPVSQLIVR